MPFTLLPPDDIPRADARHDESLIALAAQHGPAACIWASEQGLVVPRSYQNHAGFTAACERYAREGWPISVRQSGGGIVPQGPGIVNLSLAYGVDGKPMDHSEDAYKLICRIIQDALDEYGIASTPQAVEGSFCDGRYNLAVIDQGQPRKIAGTAQVWRRQKMQGSDGYQQVVLVHALILAHLDVVAATERATGFEQAIGTDKRYDPQRVASIADLCAPDDPRRDDFPENLTASLTRKIALI